MKNSLVILLILAIAFTSKGQNNNNNVALQNNTSFFISTDKEQVKKEDALVWLKSKYNVSDDISFKLLNESNDKIGFNHKRYTITYLGIPVLNGVFIVHSKNGITTSINGNIFPEIQMSNSIQLDEKELRNRALNNCGAEKYKWDIAYEEDFIKKSTGDLKASFFPKGKQEIIQINGKFYYTFKYDIYAHKPLSHAEYYMDAETGELLFKNNLIHETDVPGTAVTKYSGIQTITADSYGGSFRLRETGRGNGISTYNCQMGIDYGTAVDFTDADNYWNNVNATYDEVATDAHWATEKTYDFFYNKFSRNSIDNSGFALLSYVHFDLVEYGYSNNVNAFWDGYRMTYGDGDPTNGITPLTSIDIAGHEITHGLTSYTADLVYSYESGALNESFSDIFATAIEFYAKPAQANWILGNEIGITIRSLENPKEFGDPDTYNGTNWWTSSSDNGGVHTNSGVLNHWFYILSLGKTGTNDIGSSYSVSGIGIESASAIAYRMLTVYLTNTSNYADARTAAIQSATDLFGSCSSEVIATTNAMYAVGVGGQYSDGIVANFNSNSIYFCSTPANVSFTNQSINSTTYLWNFGDGTTSTLENPSHIYSNPGTYTVSLIITGTAACGTSDTIIKNNFITIENIGGLSSPECTPLSTNGSSTQGILNFTLGTINNTSNGGIDSYKDYSCNYITELTEGVSYPLSVKVGSTTLADVKIWIDLNNDNHFDSTTELFFTSENLANIHNGTLMIPAGAVKDTRLRFRVISDYYSYNIASACYIPINGQVEDYAVIIRSNSNPPVAEFTSDVTNIEPGQYVNFTDLSQNLPTSWTWYFTGSSTPTSNVKNPTNILYNTLGIYEVKLVVTNSFGGDSIIKTNYIKVSSSYNMCSGVTSSSALAGTLYDSGGSTGSYSNGENCSFLVNVGCATSIEISFNSFNTESGYDYLKIYKGNNTSSPLLLNTSGSSIPSDIIVNASQVLFVFTTDGSVTRSGFEINWSVQYANTSPVSQFLISDTSPPFNTDVVFTDNTTNYPISWQWSFGDGSVSIEQNPTHAFQNSGTKNIQLISTNCYTSDSIINSLNVQSPPIISLSEDTVYMTLECGSTGSHDLIVYNSGSGDLVYDVSLSGGASDSNLDVLVYTNGVDMAQEYINTINAINQHFTNYTLTQTATTSATQLEMELQNHYKPTKLYNATNLQISI